MKAKTANLTLIAAFVTATATNALAQFDNPMPESEHWRVRATESAGEPTANQRAPYGYATSGPVARVVNIDSTTRYLNVTQLEVIQINAGGKSVIWMFDTRGTVPFPLSKVISGVDGVMVYVEDNPANRSG